MREQGKSVVMYHNAVFTIDQKLIGQPNSRKLWQHICIKAESDSHTKDNVIAWVKHGGTVFLRDELCDQFKKEFECEIDWFNAFCSIDSTRVEVK